MFNLLCRYVDQPTLKNAQKLRSYERSHPMCRCLLSADQADLLANAIHHANKGE